MRESLAVPVSRSWFISIHFVEIHSFADKIAKKLLKTPILRFKVIQGYRCWQS